MLRARVIINGQFPSLGRCSRSVKPSRAFRMEALATECADSRLRRCRVTVKEELLRRGGCCRRRVAGSDQTSTLEILGVPARPRSLLTFRTEEGEVGGERGSELLEIRRLIRRYFGAAAV
ncbi:hypothetical protein MRX96_032207 [Rhipicephalus microplus]